MKQVIKLLTLAFVVALMVPALTGIGMQPAPTPQPENIPDYAVGKLFQNGGTQIYTNKLVPNFQSGHAIQQFQLLDLADGWHLIRSGHVDGGDSRTEILPLAIDPNNYLIIQPPVWFTICDLAANNCQMNAFCAPNPQNTSCFCPGGANCNFGFSPGALEDFDIVII